MTNTVYTKTYGPPEYNMKEILRYAGAACPTPEILELMESCLKEVGGKLSYKVCYREFAMRDCGEYLDLTFAQTPSADLKRNLKGCESVVLFGATVGMELDRLIARYGAISPAKALMFQAIGAERIETLCDLFNREITRQQKELGKVTKPRFSPGYGDLALAFQKDIFRVLDCPRKIGLTLNQSLLMSPSKSVTAMIGIGTGTGDCQSLSGCKACDKIHCAFRREI